MSNVLIDIHCHTSDHSYDGKVPGEVLVRTLAKQGFAGVVLTDHNYVWPAAELEELRGRAGVGAEFLLLSGQEVRTAHDGVMYGDLLVYGLEESLPDETSPMEVFKRVAAVGGFCIAPHAAVPRIGFGNHIASFPVTAVEGWNGRYGREVSAQSRRLAEEQGLPQVGGSDSHAEREIGGGGTLLEELPRDLAELGGMIRDGRCAPWQPSPLDVARRWMRGQS